MGVRKQRYGTPGFTANILDTVLKDGKKARIFETAINIAASTGKHVQGTGCGTNQIRRLVRRIWEGEQESSSQTFLQGRFHHSRTRLRAHDDGRASTPPQGQTLTWIKQAKERTSRITQQNTDNTFQEAVTGPIGDSTEGTEGDHRSRIPK